MFADANMQYVFDPKWCPPRCNDITRVLFTIFCGGGGGVDPEKNF